jgi:hypothetical protein
MIGSFHSRCAASPYPGLISLYGGIPMFKKSLSWTVAALLCLGFVFLAVPALNSAEKAPALSFRSIIRQPGVLLSSLLPSLGSAFFGPSMPGNASRMPAIKGRVKPTGDVVIPKPSVGD